MKKIFSLLLALPLVALLTFSTFADPGDPVLEGKPITGTLGFDEGTTINEFSIDGVFTDNSDDAVPTEKAVKTYVDACGGGATERLVAHVKEANVSAVKKGQMCAIVGSSGSKFEVQLCDCDNPALIRVLGLAMADTPQNASGTVVYKGILEEVDTRTTNTDVNPNAETWTAGDMLFVSRTPGGLTNVRPTSGRCIKAGRTLKGSSASDTLLAIVHTNAICACAAAGEDMCSRMGDSAGVNKFCFKDYDNVEVGCVNSNGSATFSSLTTTGTASINNTLDMNTNKIINVVDPTANQEAATKKYVDDTAVLRSTYALTNCVLRADSVGMPIALQISPSHILGRKAAGGIDDLTGADVLGILSGQAAADFSMNTYKITDMVDPTTNQDAATKKYVDDTVSNGDKIIEGDTSVETVDTGDGYIVFTEDGTEKARITDGDVGIGISPYRLFHIAKDSVAYQRLQSGVSSAGGCFISEIVKSRGSTTSPQVVVDADTLGRIAFLGYDGTNFVNAARISAIVDGIPGTGDMPGELKFETTPDGSSSVVTRMTITNAGDIGVGIDPNEKLTVEGALSLDEITAPAATAGYGKIYTKTADSLLYFKDDGGTEYNLTGGGGLNSIVDVVTDSGADNTGATDASVDINTATASLSTSGGGILWFPEGTYKLSAASLVPKSNVIWRGVKGATILNGQTTPVINQTAAAILINFGMQGFTIKDVNNVNASATVFHLRSMQQSFIRDIDIIDYETGTGFYVTPDAGTHEFFVNNMIENIYMVNAAGIGNGNGIGTGIYLRGDPAVATYKGITGNIWRHFWIDNVVNYGIRLYSAVDHDNFTNIIVRMNGTASNVIGMEVGHSSVYANNIIYSNYFYDLTFTSDSAGHLNRIGIKFYAANGSFFWGLAQGTGNWDQGGSGEFIVVDGASTTNFRAFGHDCELSGYATRHWSHGNVVNIGGDDFWEWKKTEAGVGSASIRVTSTDTQLRLRGTGVANYGAVILQSGGSNDRLKLFANNSASYLDYTGNLTFRTIASANKAILYSTGNLSLDGTLTENAWTLDQKDIDRKWELMASIREAYKSHDGSKLDPALLVVTEHKNEAGEIKDITYGKRPSDFIQVAIECIAELQERIEILEGFCSIEAADEYYN